MNAESCASTGLRNPPPKRTCPQARPRGNDYRIPHRPPRTRYSVCKVIFARRRPVRLDSQCRAISGGLVEQRPRRRATGCRIAIGKHRGNVVAMIQDFTRHREQSVRDAIPPTSPWPHDPTILLVTVALMVPCVAFAQPSPRNLITDVKEFEARHRTEHYVLGGTVSAERYEEYGRALEFIYAEYASGFEELFAADKSLTSKVDESTAKNRKERSTAATRGRPLDGDAGRFHVMILTNEAHYGEFVDAYFPGESEHTRGLFIPGINLLVICDDPDPARTYRVLFHEAFHQFLNRYIPCAPVWVNEGLATYFGMARVTPGGLVFDGPDDGYYGVVRDAMDARTLVPLNELMTLNACEFYDVALVPGQEFTRRRLHYAQSYTLVRFMLMDDAGREHLRVYLRKLAAAKGCRDVPRITREHFHADLIQRLIQPWIASVHRG